MCQKSSTASGAGIDEEGCRLRGNVSTEIDGWRPEDAVNEGIPLGASSCPPTDRRVEVEAALGKSHAEVPVELECVKGRKELYIKDFGRTEDANKDIPQGWVLQSESH